MSDSASSSTKVKKAKKVEEFKSTAKKVAKVLGLNTTQGILGGVTFALLVIGFLVLFGVFVIKSVTDPNRQLCDREVGTEIGDPFAGPTPQSAPGAMSSGISPTGYSAEGLNGKVTITLNGSSLIAPVRMEIDTTGTLHCNAIYERDAFFCMGYGGAKLRLAQMDFYRTQAQGNLAAIAGSAQISTDVFMRTMNFRKLGQDRYASLTPEARRKLDAQIDGLNEYIKNTPLSDLSPEYSVVLKRKPAFFTGADILTIEALIFTNQDFESSEINRFALLLQNRGVAAALKYIQPHRATKKDFVSTLSASDLGMQGMTQAQLDANEARSMDNSGAFDPYRPVPVPPTDDVTASQADIDAANSPSFQTSSLKRMRLRQKIATASGTGRMAYT
jgi:acyl-homoserine lactone acylase PvdQ